VFVAGAQTPPYALLRRLSGVDHLGSPEVTQASVGEFDSQGSQIAIRVGWPVYARLSLEFIKPGVHFGAAYRLTSDSWSRHQAFQNVL